MCIGKTVSSIVKQIKLWQIQKMENNIGIRINNLSLYTTVDKSQKLNIEQKKLAQKEDIL